MHPEDYSRFFGRHFRCVEKWCDWRLPAITFLGSLLLTKNNLSENPELAETDRISAHFASTASILAEYHNPTFFVAPELLEACLNSNLPPVVDWSVMKMPFESATFILPGGAFELEGKNVPYITYCRRPPLIKLFNSELEIDYRKSTFSIHSFALETGSTYDFTVDQPFGVEAVEHQLGKINASFRRENQPGSFAERDSQQILMQTVFNLLFVMDARPELVERNRKIKTENFKKRELREIWSPNILGARYRIQRQPGARAGSHASPRMHWRRGHYRLQRHGAGFTETKTIWIEPTLINLNQQRVEAAA